MARNHVDIDGMGDLIRGLERLYRAAQDAREDTLQEWSHNVEADAHRLAPRRTGTLAREIEGRVWAHIGIARVGVWGGHPHRWYARFVEKGTSKMPDEPYLLPAFLRNRRSVQNMYRRAFRRHFRGL